MTSVLRGGLSVRGLTGVEERRGFRGGISGGMFRVVREEMEMCAEAINAQLRSLATMLFSRGRKTWVTLWTPTGHAGAYMCSSSHGGCVARRDYLDVESQSVKTCLAMHNGSIWDGSQLSTC